MRLYSPCADETLSEAERTLLWRQERFLEMRFDIPEAIALSNLPHVDLHYVEDLLARGCTPHAAFKIVR